MHLRHWPLDALSITTPTLELRLPRPADLDALADLAAEGVHAPDAMPFGVAWTDAPPAERARGVLQHYWKRLAEWSPDDWSLPMAVFRDGEAVGFQDVSARGFAVVRQVSTGSWLGLRHQRQGIGTEMRAAVLHLAFSGLGAESARSVAMADNPASHGVSLRLGYRPNGEERIEVAGRLRHQQRFVIDRADWDRHRRIDAEISGLAGALAMFGVSGAPQAAGG